MLSGYSENNITDIGDVTGKFNTVIENKMLLVFNELKNYGDCGKAEFNVLKSIITD